MERSSYFCPARLLYYKPVNSPLSWILKIGCSICCTLQFVEIILQTPPLPLRGGAGVGSVTISNFDSREHQIGHPILKNREKQEKQEKRFSNCYEIEHSTAKDWKDCQNFSKQNLFTITRQSSAKKARLGALFIPRYIENRGGKANFLHTRNGFVHVFSLYLMPFRSFVSTPKNKTATPNFFRR